jgi:hypothetical protein
VAALVCDLCFVDAIGCEAHGTAQKKNWLCMLREVNREIGAKVSSLGPLLFP